MYKAATKGRRPDSDQWSLLYMDGQQLQNLCRDKMCLHLEQQMIDHVLTRLKAGETSIPVIGCDARTGVPRRLDLAQSQLADMPITTAT